MSVLSEMRLGDAITFQRGFDITKAEQTPGPVPIVSSSGISSSHNKVKVEGPGVIIGRKGTLGTVHFVTHDYWPHDTTLWVKDFKGNIPQFVAYFLRTLKLENFDAGASNPTLNRNHIHKIKVFFPKDPDIQRKIAAIPTAYDDLIEVNNRRIALLEKMAEELYREWFVRMRFPGHQNTRFVKGVPEGWEAAAIESLVKRIPPGKLYDQKTALPEGKVPILDQGRSGIIGYHNDQHGVQASLDSPLIVFANHTCYQRLIFHSFSAIQNVLPFVPKDEAFDIYWLHYATKDCIQFSEYKGHWPAFQATQIFKPSPVLTKAFGLHAKPILHEVYNLELINHNLTQTRDLLLPRLISGKLSVEDLDIQFPPSMQEDASH